MIVISKNTEKILMRDLKITYELTPKQYCFYIKFSKTKIEKDIWLPMLSECMEMMEKSNLAKFYPCHDNDVFILLETMNPRNFQALIVALSKKLDFENLANFTVAFQLEEHWPKLSAACQKKIKHLEEKQKRDNLEHNKDRRRSLVELDTELVASLSKRREANREKRVLVVDDDMLARSLIKNVLSGEYRLSFSVDGQSAISEYVMKAPDVMFLDIGLPDMSGHEVLENIFRIDPNAYVVMFSGRKDEHNVMKAVEMGAQGYVTKPFSKDKLVQYIKKSPFLQTKQNVS